MTDFLANLTQRLFSRKFWFAAAAFMAALAQFIHTAAAGDYEASMKAIDAMVAIVVAYGAVEGAGDLAARYGAAKRGPAPIDAQKAAEDLNKRLDEVLGDDPAPTRATISTGTGRRDPNHVSEDDLVGSTKLPMFDETQKRGL